MAYINLGQVIYPIGAIFASTSSTSPSSMFGGTWSQIVDDACLMAGTSVGNVGSKTITINNMPEHSHRAKGPGTVSNYHAGGTLFGSALTGAWEYSYGFDTQPTGGGQDYLPYSYRCYMWRRTA